MGAEIADSRIATVPVSVALGSIPLLAAQITAQMFQFVLANLILMSPLTFNIVAAKIVANLTRKVWFPK